jgi:hypothetical protein
MGHCVFGIGGGYCHLFTMYGVSADWRIHRTRVLSDVTEHHRFIHACKGMFLYLFCKSHVSFIVLGNSADALAIVSLIYYANLLASMIFAPREKSGGKLLCMGLVFFALCDINVGLVVLHDLYGGFEEGSFLYLLTHSGVDLAWIFYIPSQTIIPLTLLVREKSQKMHCSPLAQ